MSSNRSPNYRIFGGETLGTFILVFLGCGSVLSSLVHVGWTLYKVAGIWAIAVFLGIKASSKLSGAHLNPAVTLGFWIRDKNSREIPYFLSGQFLGAALAAVVLLLCFNPALKELELSRGIVRASAQGIQTAMGFGEFYPNPGFSTSASFLAACSYEGIGTFVLMAVILLCGRIYPTKAFVCRYVHPVLISLTLFLLIVWIAPYTQAGFNPARDFAPRMVAFFSGWGAFAFPDQVGGFFWIYMLSPTLGAVLAALLFRKIKA